MIESKDILFFVLAFCVLWFTLFLSWLIWQVATILKNLNDVLSETKDKINKIETAITGMRKKFDKATSMVALVGTGIEKLIEHALDKKREKGSDDVA